MAVPAMYLPVLSAWFGLLTLFAPSDDSLHSCPSCSPLRLLREHLIPSLFSLPYLSKLAFGTELETASPGRCLTVTSSAAAALYPGLTANSSDIKIFIDGIEVTHPDLFNDGRFVIHGIDGFVTSPSPLSCSHGDPHPAFAPELATAGASALPGSVIMRLMLRYVVATFPCNPQLPNPTAAVSTPLLLRTDPPSVPFLASLCNREVLPGEEKKIPSPSPSPPPSQSPKPSSPPLSPSTGPLAGRDDGDRKCKTSGHRPPSLPGLSRSTGPL